jgi:hypothetical protein
MITRRTFLAYGLSLPVLGLATAPAMADIPEFFKAEGYAATGFDVVAYFTQGKPIEGNSNFSLKWKGTVWRFASAENMASFEADAWKYAPQYGGYCAFAMAKGAIARSVPDAWTVYEDKLYLNQSKLVRVLWKRDIPSMVRDADQVWPAILQG